MELEHPETSGPITIKFNGDTETQYDYDKLPEGVKEPQIFDQKHGLNDSPQPEGFSQKDVLIENGTDSGTDTP
jgi:hypothetical protein